MDILNYPTAYPQAYSKAGQSMLPIEEITLKESGSRIRLSANLLTPLAWTEFGDDFDCWAIFRYPGELLCAPKALTVDDGTHPFAAALAAIELPPSGHVSPLHEVPPSRVLTAFQRVFSFQASWSSGAKKQLDLKLGVDNTALLGWSKGSGSRVYGIPWTRILVLLSQKRYEEVQKQDFTDGSLRL